MELQTNGWAKFAPLALLAASPQSASRLTAAGDSDAREPAEGIEFGFEPMTIGGAVAGPRLDGDEVKSPDHRPYKPGMAPRQEARFRTCNPVEITLERAVLRVDLIELTPVEIVYVNAGRSGAVGGAYHTWRRDQTNN